MELIRWESINKCNRSIKNMLYLRNIYRNIKLSTWLDLFNCVNGFRPPKTNSVSLEESFFSLKWKHETCSCFKATEARTKRMLCNISIHLPWEKAGHTGSDLIKISNFFLIVQVLSYIVQVWSYKYAKIQNSNIWANLCWILYM